MQSDEALIRDVYVQPKKKDYDIIWIGEGGILKLNLPLYGTCDANDYCSGTIDRHTKQDPGLTPLTGNRSLYVVPESSEGLQGLLGQYVDDSLIAGTEALEKLTEQTLKTFYSRDRVYDRFDFVDVMISATPHLGFVVKHSKHIARLQLLSSDTDFKVLRSTHTALAWVSLTRPYIAFAVNRAAQVTEKNYTPQDIE